MKEKFMRFMQGRNGVDQFARFTMGVALAAIVLPYLLGPEVELAHFWICLEWLPLFILISGFFPKIFPNVIRRIRSIFR